MKRIQKTRAYNREYEKYKDRENIVGKQNRVEKHRKGQRNMLIQNKTSNQAKRTEKINKI